MALLCLLLLAVTVAESPLPTLSYRYGVFAVPDPAAAASFMAKFTGAAPLSNRSQWQLGSDASAGLPGADIAAVRLFYGGSNNGGSGGSSGVSSSSSSGGSSSSNSSSSGGGAPPPPQPSSWSDVYFVRDDSLPSRASMDPQAFSAQVAATHSMANDDWDWWQDWHLAFAVADIDAVATRLLKHEVPFVSRGSIYFAIPGTAVTIQVLGAGSGEVYWAEPFLFCRETTDGAAAPGGGTAAASPRYPLNTSDVIALPDRPLPPFVPSHQSLATAHANATAQWARRFLAVAEVDEKTGAGESHAYAGGTCAEIAWMEVSPGGWQLHFIEQYRKRQGPLGVADWQRQQRALHGGMGAKDAYHNFRVGLAVPQLAPYLDNLRAHAEPFFQDPADPKRVRLQTPSGYILELFEEEGGVGGGGGGFDATAAEAAIAAAVHE
jgi:hypothetical protein